MSCLITLLVIKMSAVSCVLSVSLAAEVVIDHVIWVGETRCQSVIYMTGTDKL